MEQGLVSVLPGVKDPQGRGVLLMDPSKQDASRFQRVQVVQAFWYAVHAILESEDTQKRGVICLACPRHAKFSQFDSKVDQMIIEVCAAIAKCCWWISTYFFSYSQPILQSVKGCLPLRISCISICHPPSFFRVIWPIVRVFLGSRLRKRVNVFCGSDEAVVKKIEGFGLTKDQIPELIGGNLKLENKAWLEERQRHGK